MNPSKQKASTSGKDTPIDPILYWRQQLDINTPILKTSARLPSPTTAEHQQPSSEWNYSELGYHVDKCLHQLFEAQAVRTPQATALVFEAKELTYAGLNERANQLAYYLRSRGVVKESLVPLCIGRSLEMIVGILGILKAGGAYVPIDPAYPAERIAYMLEDTYCI
jgi:non-ribosomal peptide synthetase component F